jgi:hypothetical protein
MPATTQNLDNGRGVIIKLEGHVTGEEYDGVLIEHLTQSEDILKKYYYSITDATQVTEISVDIQNIKKIVSHCLEAAKINPDVIIVIATNSSIAFSLARIWAFLASASKWNIQVFRTREELDKWLLMKMKDIHDMSDLELDHHLIKTNSEHNGL